MSLFNRNLNDIRDVARLISSGRLFHARIIEGKKISFEFRRLCLVVS